MRMKLKDLLNMMGPRYHMYKIAHELGEARYVFTSNGKLLFEEWGDLTMHVTRFDWYEDLLALDHESIVALMNVGAIVIG